MIQPKDQAGMSFFYYDAVDDWELEVVSRDTPVWGSSTPTTPYPPELKKLQVTTLLVVCAVGLLIVMCLCACMFYGNERLLSAMPWRRKTGGRRGRRPTKRGRGITGLPGPFGRPRDPGLRTMMGQGILMPGLYTQTAVPSRRPRPSIVVALSPKGEAAQGPTTPTSGASKPKGTGLKGAGLLVSPDTLQGALSTGATPRPSLANVLQPDTEGGESDASSVAGSVCTPDTPRTEVSECNLVVDMAEEDVKEKGQEKEAVTKYPRKSLRRKPRRSKANVSANTPDAEIGTLTTEMTCMGGRI